MTSAEDEIIRKRQRDRARITALLLGAFVVLLFFIPTLQANDAMVWLWTCLAGFVLGLLGLSVYALQRRAARLGRRSANQMALDESI